MSNEERIEVQRELERHSVKIEAVEKELCNLKKLIYILMGVALGSPHLSTIASVLKIM